MDRIQQEIKELTVQMKNAAKSVSSSTGKKSASSDDNDIIDVDTSSASATETKSSSSGPFGLQSMFTMMNTEVATALVIEHRAYLLFTAAAAGIAIFGEYASI